MGTGKTVSARNHASFHIQFRTDTTSIENCLCQLVQMQGKAYMAKYNPKLEVKDENSVLYGLPEKAVQEEFARLVSDSAAYIVFRKCGIQPDVFEETGAFQNISHLIALKCSWHWGIMQQRLRNLC